VSLRKRLRTLFVCFVLEFGVLSGVPMQARELEELMRQLHTPKIAHELPSKEEGGDGARRAMTDASIADALQLPG
jgi:hypothetical protein